MHRTAYFLIGVGLTWLALVGTGWAAPAPHHNSNADADATAISGSSATATGVGVGIGGGAEVENSNRNVNRNTNVGINSQYQGQSQSSFQAQGQGQFQGQGQSVNNKQTISPTQTTSVTVEGDDIPRLAPPAIAPNLIAVPETCMGSSAVGVSSPFGGVSIGTTWKSEPCELRMFARSLLSLGQKEAALALLAQDEAVARALAAAGVTVPGLKKASLTPGAAPPASSGSSLTDLERKRYSPTYPFAETK